MSRSPASGLTLSSTKPMFPASRIVPVRPRSGKPCVREIFVSDQVAELLSDNAAARKADFPDAVARALIDSFLLGRLIKVSLKGNGTVDLERMRNVDEVWVLCFRRVSDNQWRIMGRFSSFNKFVGLTAHKRSDLKGKSYDEKGRECVGEWLRCFKRLQPLRGNHWSDYLSAPVQNADDQEF